MISRFLRRIGVTVKKTLVAREQDQRFHAYVEQFLVPTLKQGDVVVFDNLGFHKGKAVRKAIRDVAAHLVFLPKILPRPQPH